MFVLMLVELVSGNVHLFKCNELQTAFKLESYIPLGDFKAIIILCFYDSCNGFLRFFKLFVYCVVLFFFLMIVFLSCECFCSQVSLGKDVLIA